MTTINIRVDDDVKRKAGALFSDLGLDLSTAINMFLRKAIMYNGIPFGIRLETPNAETLAALEELRKVQTGELKEKIYTDVDAMFRELNEDAQI